MTTEKHSRLRKWRSFVTALVWRDRSGPAKSDSNAAEVIPYTEPVKLIVQNYD